jgi:hypothetical protein
MGSIAVPFLEFTDGSKLIYCHLTLSRDGRDSSYDNLVYELDLLSKYIEEDCTIFGDFNFTLECRQRLFTEQSELMKKLCIKFGEKSSDISFVTFPHDRVPLSVFEACPENILESFPETGNANCVSALDLVCGKNVKSVRRLLPFGDFTEVSLEQSPSEIVHFLKSQGMPPVNEWLSDHWILELTF